MRDLALIRHLLAYGCELEREGGRHSIYANREARKTSAVPRHREVNDILARRICRDLEILDP